METRDNTEWITRSFVNNKAKEGGDVRIIRVCQSQLELNIFLILPVDCAVNCIKSSCKVYKSFTYGKHDINKKYEKKNVAKKLRKKGWWW